MALVCRSPLHSRPGSGTKRRCSNKPEGNPPAQPKRPPTKKTQVPNGRQGIQSPISLCSSASAPYPACHSGPAATWVSAGHDPSISIPSQTQRHRLLCRMAEGIPMITIRHEKLAIDFAATVKLVFLRQSCARSGLSDSSQQCIHTPNLHSCCSNRQGKLD
jgi:hypothetical protein